MKSANCYDSSKHSPKISGGYIDNTKRINNDDDDFFESLRKRQSERDEGQEEKTLSENKIDFNLPTIALDTDYEHLEDVPELIPNISPASILTTTSEEKCENKEFDRYEKAEISDKTITADSKANISMKGFLLRFAFIAIFASNAACWFANEQRMIKRETGPTSSFNLRILQDQNAQKKTTRFRQCYQDSNQSPQNFTTMFEILVIGNEVDVKEGNHEKIQIQKQHQQEEKAVALRNEKPNEENNAACGTHRIEELQVQELNDGQCLEVQQPRQRQQQQSQKFTSSRQDEDELLSITETDGLEFLNEFLPDKKLNPSLSAQNETQAINVPINNDFQGFVIGLNVAMQSLRSRCRMMVAKRSFKIHQFKLSFVEQLAPVVKSLFKRMMHQAKQKAQITNQVTIKSMKMTGGILERPFQIAKSIINGFIQKITNITEHVTNVSVSMTGDMMDFLTRVKSAMGQMKRKIHLSAKYANKVMTRLASTNSKIQANSHNMVGGRESFTNVGKVFGKRIFRIMSRKLKITSINI